MINMISFTSSLDFDNVKSQETKTFDNVTSATNPLLNTYPAIKITNAFGLGDTLFEGYISKHDNNCGSSCSSTIKIKLGQEGVLIDDVIFNTLQEDGSWIEQNVKSYQFYISSQGKSYEVNDYETQCIKGKELNGTNIQTCSNVLIGHHTEYETILTKYNLGDKVPAGVYTIKLEAERNSKRTIDWKIKTNGEWLNEWAIWGADNGLVAYYSFDDASGTLIRDNVSKLFNGTLVNGLASPWLSGASCKVGGCLNLSAPVDYAYFGTSDSDGFNAWNNYGNNFALSFWLNQISYQDNGIITKSLLKSSPSSYGQFDLVGNNNPIFDGNLIMRINQSGFTQNNTGIIPNNQWSFIVVQYNQSYLNFYVNGVLNRSDAVTLNVLPQDSPILLAIYYDDTYMKGYGNFSIDELGYWNRTLSQSEITELYNGGSGLGYGEDTLKINFPLNQSYYINDVSFLNYSLGVYANDKCWYSTNGGTTNSSTVVAGVNFTISPTAGQNTWTLFCNSTTGGNYSAKVTFQANVVNENSRTYNSLSYDTAYETYSLNVTANSSLTAVNLLYAGTSYPMISSGGLWNYSRDLPESAVGNNSINFSFTYAGNTYYANTLSYQQVNKTIFTECNTTYPVQYINLTFKDEADLTSINASIPTSTWVYYLGSGGVTKSYTFINNSDNLNYTFCSNTNRTLYADPYVQYKQGASYPQRIYDPTYLTLTNSSTSKILYLLSSADGIYTTFQVLDVGNKPLSGVQVSGVRTISSESVIVATGTTDSAGSVTFWVNPDFEHIFTFSKSGYSTTQYTITPTQSSYTITMGSNTSVYQYVSDYEGLKWYAFPQAGVINDTSARYYGFNISARKSNLVGCKIELLNEWKNVTLANATAVATGSGSACYVQVSYNVNSTYPKMKGRLMVDLGSGYQILEDDVYWIYKAIDTTGMTIKDWFNDLKTFDLSYFNNDPDHREYTYILIFFLFVAIIIAVLNQTGWDIQTQGGMIYLMGILIWIASVPGFLTLNGISPYGSIDKYFVAVIYSFFMIGYGGRNLR